MTEQIKALQTPYRGVTYRSRTEARWAVFFDEIRLAYDYEPEGFDVGGEWYLPDFWLPQPGLWFEVKGVAPNGREERVAASLSKLSRSRVVIAVGPPPTTEDFTLRIYADGQFDGEAAFTGWGDSLFISDEWNSRAIRIRGSSDIGGAPSVLTAPARLAAACRFGVHD